VDDDELLDELRKEKDDPAPVVRAAPASAPQKKGVPSWVSIVVVLGILGLIVSGLLLTTDFGSVFVYSRRIEQVMAAPDEYVDREVRIEGELKRGSIQFQHEPCEHRFVLKSGGREMPVRFPRCEVPDTFRDDMPVTVTVVVQGRLQSDGTFLADQIAPRCASHYQEMRNRQQNGEMPAAPHGLPPMSGQTS